MFWRVPGKVAVTDCWRPLAITSNHNCRLFGKAFVTAASGGIDRVFERCGPCITQHLGTNLTYQQERSPASVADKAVRRRIMEAALLYREPRLASLVSLTSHANSPMGCLMAFLLRVSNAV